MLSLIVGVGVCSVESWYDKHSDEYVITSSRVLSDSEAIQATNQYKVYFFKDRTYRLNHDVLVNRKPSTRFMQWDYTYRVVSDTTLTYDD